MNSNWKTFLESQSAVIADDGSASFSNAPAFPDCALHDLSHLGLVRVSGDDAAIFLQGQFTNNVEEVSDSHSQMSGYCSPKGRMLANFRLFRVGDAFYLQMARDVLAGLMKRLPMFVLMSKVTIEDVSDQLVRVGLSGDCAESLLAGAVDSTPVNPGDVSQGKAITVMRLPGDRPRFEILGEAGEMEALWQQFSSNATPANADLWSLLDIRAGIPFVREATVEAFVPQMLNMQLIDGVSFSKGCYTGQEIVARMKYLGQLKRRMYLARVDRSQPPRPGEELGSTGSESGQGAGKVVASAPSPDGGYELLVVTETAAVERDDLYLGEEPGVRLQLAQLPYPFEDA
jgi:folate-binding protein YgfZ